MKFFADTASIKEIEECFLKGVDDGITTNPGIMQATGDLSFGFEAACKAILQAHPSVPVSLETDLRGLNADKIHSKPQEVKDILLKQAYELASWGKNVVVKIPICEGGLLATQELARNNIKTNVTACMTPYQALAAADAGAAYVSLFANRMLDAHILDLAGHNLEDVLRQPDWKGILKSAQTEFSNTAWIITLNHITYVAKKLESKYPKTELIVGSIRSPEDIHRLASAGPQVITIPAKIVRELTDIPELKKTQRKILGSAMHYGSSLYHPMTQITLVEFEKAADSYRNKP